MQAITLAVSIRLADEPVAQYAVKGMLHACQALCGIIVFVVDVYVVVLDGILHLRAEQIVVNERFCGLAREFHHHSCRGVGVHVGVLARDVIALGLYDFQEDVARLCASGDGALVAVSDISLCDVLS